MMSHTNRYDRWYRIVGVTVLITTSKGFNTLLHMIILLSVLECEYR